MALYVRSLTDVRRSAARQQGLWGTSLRIGSNVLAPGERKKLQGTRAERADVSRLRQRGALQVEETEGSPPSWFLEEGVGVVDSKAAYETDDARAATIPIRAPIPEGDDEDVGVAVPPFPQIPSRHLLSKEWGVEVPPEEVPPEAAEPDPQPVPSEPPPSGFHDNVVGQRFKSKGNKAKKRK